MAAAVLLSPGLSFMQPRPVEPIPPKVSLRTNTIWHASREDDDRRAMPRVCEFYKTLKDCYPRTVSVDYVIKRLWGKHPPDQARTAVHNLASELRAVLRAFDWTVISEDGFVGGPNGYRLKYQPSSDGMVQRVTGRGRP